MTSVPSFILSCKRLCLTNNKYNKCRLAEKILSHIVVRDLAALPHGRDWTKTMAEIGEDSKFGAENVAVVADALSI